MGRPPKPKNEKQSEKVSVKMTRAERRELEAAARKAGLSLSAYILAPHRKPRA